VGRSRVKRPAVESAAMAGLLRAILRSPELAFLQRNATSCDV